MIKTTSTLTPTPTEDRLLPRRFADFSTLVEAVEYAALGQRGLNFYSARGDLDEVLSYKDLLGRSQDFAQRLTGMGLPKGARVALIAETAADFVVAFVGCHYASVLPVPLPLPTSFGGREGYVQQLARQLISCDANAVIVPDDMTEFVTEAAVGRDLAFVGSLNKLVATVPASGELRRPTENDVAYLQYSSGSTRFPHGVIVSQKSLMANCFGMGYHGVALQEDDRCISWLPFYHDMGLVGTLLTPLTCQVTVDFLATESFARRPLQWLRLMSKNRGTITYSPTFGYDLCARRITEEAAKSLDLSAWRVAGIGAEMIRPDVMEHFLSVFHVAGFRPTTFLPSYGLAECTLAVSFMPVNTGIATDKVDERILSGDISLVRSNGHVNSNGHASRFRDVVNCGIPLPEYEIEIRDAAGHVMGDRDIGRIFLRGVSVMQGYFNDEDATNEVLSKDGWLDTGDMGYMRDSSIYIIGRAKDMIIVNGRNHWPQDIEWAVEQLPGIRSGDIAAISLPGDNDEEVPTVLVQCRLRADDERRDFIEQVKSIIQQETGIQCRIELIPPKTLPRTSSGKLSRAKARQQFLMGGFEALAV